MFEKFAFSLQELLYNIFPIKKPGEATSFLGIKIIRDSEKRKMWLLQQSYMAKIGKTHYLKPDGRSLTPLAPDFDVSHNTGERLSAELIQTYQRKDGSAIYASICTRPDIALAVSMCADHLVNPATRHLHAITHILQYQMNTEKYAVKYDFGLSEPNGPKSYMILMASDASFGDNEGRKSSQGFVAFLYGGPVLWHSNKQRSVTTSTTEAELVTLSAAARELLALKIFERHMYKRNTISTKLICLA